MRAPSCSHEAPEPGAPSSIQTTFFQAPGSMTSMLIWKGHSNLGGATLLRGLGPHQRGKQQQQQQQQHQHQHQHHHHHHHHQRRRQRQRRRRQQATGNRQQATGNRQQATAQTIANWFPPKNATPWVPGSSDLLTSSPKTVYISLKCPMDI